MNNFKSVLGNKVSRRKFISGVSAGLGATAAVSFAAGCSGSSSTTAPAPAAPSAPTYNDFDILNFALNLEYLEAEFYLRAVTGQGLAAADIGATPGLVTGGAQVPFTAGGPIQQYAAEVAAHEQLHVQFLRAAVTSLGGTPVARPQINFTDAFNTAASAAGIGASFTPFDSEQDFLLGSFTFEDVGVTAYDGAAPLITNKAVVLAAAGSIVAVEAYHAGLVRYLISALRTTASIAVTGGAGDEGAALSSTTLVPADSNSLAYSRTFDQVLHIVYLNPNPGVTSKGGFFPNGMNATITASAS